MKRSFLFGTAVLTWLLLFSCKGEIDRQSGFHEHKSVHFKKDTLSYTFVNKTGVFGLGGPFDFVYNYDAETDRELVYQLQVRKENDVRIVVFELTDTIEEPIANDTFQLAHFHVEPKTQKLFLTIDQNKNLNIVKRNVIKPGATHLDSVFSYQRGKRMRAEEIVLGENDLKQVVSYSIDFNQIMSYKYLSRIVPIYEYGVPFEQKLTVPTLFDLKNKNGLWSIGENFQSLSEEQHDLVETPFTIHHADRVCHLNPGVPVINIYYPELNEFETIQIPTVEFNTPIDAVESEHKKIVKHESDYWLDFIYNPYLKSYYLFQHIGQPYFDASGNVADLDPDEGWLKILILDDQLNYLGDTTITNEQEYKTVHHPKLPTPNGYFSLEFDEVVNDSTGTVFHMNFQKMILHE